MIRVILLARPQEYHMDAILRSYWSHDQYCTAGFTSIMSGGCLIRIHLVSSGCMIRVLLLVRHLEYQGVILSGSHWS